MGQSRQWAKYAAGAVAGLAFAGMTTSASANIVVNFEAPLAPNIFAVGDSFSSNGFEFTLADVGNGAGQLDTSAGCFFVCPTGNGSQFFSILNDGVLRISAPVNVGLLSIDAGLIAPVPQAASPLPFGRLVIADSVGVVLAQRDLTQNQANGEFTFSTFSFADGLQSSGPIQIFACTFDAGNNCVRDNGNLSQIAIDNLRLRLPEPGVLGLGLIGVAGILASRRRRSK